jgi:hypothetical protein
LPIELGERDCQDDRSGIELDFLMLADRRPHQDPIPTTLEAATGAAPVVARIRGTGGFLCRNDLALRVRTQGGAPASCYQLTVTGTKKPHELVLSGTGEAQLVVPGGAYASGATLSLMLRRTCPPTPERVAVHLEFHL